MTFAFTRTWIALSALLVTAGWGLSWFHALNRTGYAVVLGAAAVAAIPWALRARKSRRPVRWASWRRRLRRPWPLAFFFFVACTAVAGTLYAPNNYDALTYRVPRVLHWLAEGQWHWIHTIVSRMNNRAQGCEWTLAPLVLFAGSERLLWLANFFMFTALPGLAFVVLRGFGVRRRVAWQWMWLLPCGYCFLLQAGGISSDLPGAFFALAAMALAFRARHSGRAADVLFSALAIALSSEMKASNTALALPWLVAVWPSLRLLAARPLATGLLAPVCLLVSFVPTGVLNQRYCGDWSGAVLDMSELHTAPARVLALGNTAGMLIQNFTPPVFPLAPWWNQHLSAWFPSGLLREISANFESQGAVLNTTELQIEEGAGLGFGLSVLLAVAAVVAIFGRRESRRPGWNGRLLRWALAIATFVYLSKMGATTVARIFSPFYPLLAAVILSGKGQEKLSRQRWWGGLIAFQFACALGLLVASPARPLWPAISILRGLAAKPGVPQFIPRLLRVYEVQRARPDALAPLRDALPAGETVVGLMPNDDLETSLWRPFLHRRFVHILATDPPEAVAQAGVHWIVINGDEFLRAGGMPLAAWLAARHLELVQTIEITSQAVIGPRPWHLVRKITPAL